MKPLKVAFETSTMGHWQALFHILRMEQPDLRLQWRRTGFPVRDRPLLGSADVGLFAEPPPEAGLSALTIETGEMVVLTAVGHRLGLSDELRVADILDQPFPGGPELDPQWRAFWTLDVRRGGPPPLTDDHVESSDEALDVVAAGRAIATVPATMAGGLPHPGVIAIPLTDGPPVATRLVWRSDDENPTVHSVIELAAAMSCDLRSDSPSPAIPGPRPPGRRADGVPAEPELRPYARKSSTRPPPPDFAR